MLYDWLSLAVERSIVWPGRGCRCVSIVCGHKTPARHSTLTHHHAAIFRWTLVKSMLSLHRFKALFLRAFITLTTDYIYKFKKRVLFNVPASYHDANCNVHPWLSGVCIHFPLDGWRLVTRHSAASSLSLTSAHFNHNICFTIKHETLYKKILNRGVLNPLALHCEV